MRITQRDIEGLTFAAEMYAVQYDQLAARLGIAPRALGRIAARWCNLGYARTGLLGAGPPWAWVTPKGMKALGLPYRGDPPALVRLRHLRAVTAIRLIVDEGEDEEQGPAGHWRSERDIRSRYRAIIRDHMPDGEMVRAGSGGRWAIEAELTPKSVQRTATIMRELTSRNRDYGPENGYLTSIDPPLYQGVAYFCSPAAVPVVRAAIADLGNADKDRVHILPLPRGALPPRTLANR